MRKEIQLTPPNSVVLVMDYAAGVIPKSMAHAIIASTASCVAVGTFPEQDGPTTISISDEVSADILGQPAFDDVLDMPNKQLSVCNVDNQALLTIDVPGTKTRVRIWVNHPTWPDRIDIVAT
jgi:hypothetical protein